MNVLYLYCCSFMYCNIQSIIIPEYGKAPILAENVPKKKASNINCRQKPSERNRISFNTETCLISQSAHPLTGEVISP